MAKSWEKIGAIAGIISLLVTFVAFISSIVVPEVRCFFRLKSEVCSSVPVPENLQESPSKPAIVKSYFIEIFFSEDRDDLRREATNIQNGLIKHGFNLEKVVLKPVSELTLQNLEFPKSNEVRFDIGYEEIPAESLRQLLGEIVPSKRFNLRDANNPEPTKGYISIFLIP